ncbi:hypothetical protein KHY18_22180 [Acidovorax sp. CCYZU-2555]|nr:hypothetical protein [Acidovorax sp. CCYZU-2555]
MNTRDIYVVGTARTAIGTFGGGLKDVPTTQLATTVVAAAIARSGLDPQAVGHVVMGNVIPTETRDAYLSRVAAIDAGCPIETPAFNVNRLCGSGLQAIVSAAKAIALGHPVGATGAIITTKAIAELQRSGGRYALVTMCIGGGQGIAAIFERV